MKRPQTLFNIFASRQKVLPVVLQAVQHIASSATPALNKPSSRNSGGKNFLTTNRTSFWRTPTPTSRRYIAHRPVLYIQPHLSNEVRRTRRGQTNPATLLESCGNRYQRVTCSRISLATTLEFSCFGDGKHQCGTLTASVVKIVGTLTVCGSSQARNRAYARRHTQHVDPDCEGWAMSAISVA
ncbi:hypothetical protein DFJ58DRAFT_817401 [Suillus subalutaceus]|uniref:uncharacterized protein n=1 Tax=Suillus subalutaceus TaxID=48586 RepID=UPI001B868E4D|nr:uncharacterized protein DFJ58DRAFT_817401 [Suillus subalutaceus]KAG1836814.1 hypothetical protein DFJ58DRAFT_817401 [Suillus subalutaceus]